ncbi:MAG TPA: hypothetical protein VIO60_07775 [Rectinemataceae bacterium]
MGKRSTRALALPLVLLLSAAFAMLSCELPVSGSALSDGDREETKALGAAGANLTTIFCTASLPPECFFFEFDIVGAKKTARALLPLSGESYIKDGKLKYKVETYRLESFGYDPSTGAMFGQTAVRGGVSYSFQGSYDPVQGFFGYLTRVQGARSATGMLGGVSVALGKEVSYYVGEATYLFQTPTPQTLLFGAAVDSRTGAVYGTWCESGQGWPYSIHGSVGGAADEAAIHITAQAFPGFLPLPMSAEGECLYKNPSKMDVSGSFNITYDGQLLRSVLTAAKEI